MKKLLSIVLLGVALFTFALQGPALAEGNPAAGAGVFTGNCAACHMGGRNTINPQKTLSKEDLEKNGMNSAEAIIKQVTNGKMAMPAFKGRLKPQQIEDVAAYVLQQAEAGW